MGESAGAVSTRIQVVHFQRKSGPGLFSIERMFADLRAAMPPTVEVKLRVNRFRSKGVLRRLIDVLGASRHCGAVNHVLGDVHYVAWLLPRRRLVLTILDCVSLERLRGPRRWLFWLIWYWGPVKRAAQITVISEFSRQALMKWVPCPSERIHVIPPPLSPEFVHTPLASRVGRPRLLQFGYHRNKNLLRVIESLRHLPVTLVIVGALRPVELDALAQSNIDYENHVDLNRADLVEQYRRADLVVFVSTYEGFGLPIIEAQAVGRPVVTGNICAMPETAGGAACMVDPLDTADIRRGICKVLDDPAYAAELVEHGLKNAARYSLDRIALRYAAIYEAIVVTEQARSGVDTGGNEQARTGPMAS